MASDSDTENRRYVESAKPRRHQHRRGRQDIAAMASTPRYLRFSPLRRVRHHHHHHHHQGGPGSYVSKN
ncbi:hypothetical protein LX32DRAFT_640312 [Colletotrichum zoysiae]|uniref:Uncharacterized protein n=1 Tax=Colletotrichum zoysiae TaxID=1216348 RepID=A0AAD9HH45_9PEZI|nr:hypothetical protein LX32DRAFT_640312 [Colletotrichum zoysiae]